MIARTVCVVVALMGFCLSLTVRGASAETCGDLSSLKMPDTTIKSASIVPGGQFSPPSASGAGLQANPPKPITVPEFCRVELLVAPSIRIEVWMPTVSWNEDFEGIGEGGYAGNIAYGPMATALGAGYATASTDTGHVGGTADFALGHPELIVDFAYRSNHEMTLKAKQIIQAFYGKVSKHAYFNGCSEGGRQGLAEAQRFPQDYDGVVSGAPMVYHSKVEINNVSLAINTTKEASSYIPATKLVSIQNAAVAACDAIDGLRDGLIDDPRKCHFDPSVLLCKGDDSDSCLTTAQLVTLKALYQGTFDTKGRLIYPGRMPGVESGWTNLVTGVAPGKGSLITAGIGYMKNFVFKDASWDYRNWEPAKDIPLVENDMKNNSILDQDNPDLRPYFKRGGKLILYQGWGDEAISPIATIGYYKKVVARYTEIGKQGDKEYQLETSEFDRAVAQASTSVRLFMVPGMDHCTGGSGPNVFNTTAAITDWVEKQQAPDKIIASRMTNAIVGRTRPLCPYPQTARYSETGSIDDEANFTCEMPAITK